MTEATESWVAARGARASRRDRLDRAGGDRLQGYRPAGAGCRRGARLARSTWPGPAGLRASGCWPWPEGCRGLVAAPGPAAGTGATTSPPTLSRPPPRRHPWVCIRPWPVLQVPHAVDVCQGPVQAGHQPVSPSSIIHTASAGADATMPGIAIGDAGGVYFAACVLARAGRRRNAGCGPGCREGWRVQGPWRVARGRGAAAAACSARCSSRGAGLAARLWRAGGPAGWRPGGSSGCSSLGALVLLAGAR